MTHHCASTPKEVFFPRAPAPGRKGLSWDRYNTAVTTAQAVCDGCPMQLPCYQGAVTRGEVMGIWGGVDFNGRRRPQPVGPPCGGPHCGTYKGYQALRRQADRTHQPIHPCPPCRAASAERQRHLHQARKHRTTSTGATT